ncbi:class I SAM-dependent methyltransferase [Limibacter armeniacum]|uniref:class I SAM-dependent methyltransferase n=1 Tax=Limibacter armeniacum TaxID=466084 RepID=UPI002FE5D167
MPGTPDYSLQKDGNFSFYENITLEKFQYFANVIGLHTGKDIDIIYPRIKDAEEIVELGPGYGRALDFILEKGYKGKITGVERIPQFVNYMNERYKGSVTVEELDIRDYRFELPRKVGAVLWLWSGILELTAEEQLNCIAECSRSLVDGGVLVIEAPYQEIKKLGNVEDSSSKKIKFETEWGTLNAYFTSLDDIENFASKTGFSRVDYTVYKTDTDLERVVYFLYKD